MLVFKAFPSSKQYDTWVITTSNKNCLGNEIGNIDFSLLLSISIVRSFLTYPNELDIKSPIWIEKIKRKRLFIFVHSPRVAVRVYTMKCYENNWHQKEKKQKEKISFCVAVECRILQIEDEQEEICSYMRKAIMKSQWQRSALMNIAKIYYKLLLFYHFHYKRQLHKKLLSCRFHFSKAFVVLASLAAI
jgi:hypothetical protein